ncbi:MAG: HAMP domain-containing histidine kinase [Actinomycetia bacterium]|nr:HAMP domain-containing histidine kinase [Actinomycetes bacterium]MCP5032179.1 HAMP domain-containing histidine kinase [Actinomycetes bacterium]
MESKGRWWQGLLARVTLAYAIGALLLSLTVAGATFLLAQNRLLTFRQDELRQQAYFNAEDLRVRMESFPEDAEIDIQDDYWDVVLEGMRHPNGSQPLILLAEGDVKSEVLTRVDIPPDMIAYIRAGTDVAHQRYRTPEGAPAYVVGIEVDDLIYYEVLRLTELEATLDSLRTILIVVTLASSVAGAMLGYYSARRALAPVPRISGAARAIAAGDFTARLELQADPNLDVLSAAFNEMVDAVGDRIDREQRFTSDVSHELRSPLMTLTASVEVLERRMDSLPHVAQQAVELLSQDLERFQRLVEDLLEISRLEAGAVKLQLSRFRLAEFLVNVLAQSKCAHVELNFSEDDAQTSITADKRRLAQVMTNLLENAEKYGNEISGVSFEVVGRKVQIVVDDTGPGVPADQRERIFERFRRQGATAGNRATATGFGLGLSLVAEHARIHGGKVWVTDRIDGQHGARFVVELPLGEHIDVIEEMAT